ncbi:hypothetical protein NKH77_00760 [Streptomyces sp. M19]
MTGWHARHLVLTTRRGPPPRARTRCATNCAPSAPR